MLCPSAPVVRQLTLYRPGLIAPFIGAITGGIFPSPSLRGASSTAVLSEPVNRIAVSEDFTLSEKCSVSAVGAMVTVVSLAGTDLVSDRCSDRAPAMPDASANGIITAATVSQTRPRFKVPERCIVSLPERIALDMVTRLTGVATVECTAAISPVQSCGPTLSYPAEYPLIDPRPPAPETLQRSLPVKRVTMSSGDGHLNRTRYHLFAAAAAASALFLSACSDSSAPGFEGPPELPFGNSMRVDLAFFTEDEAPIEPGIHYDAARATVLAAATATTTPLALPASLYAGAAQAAPVEQADGFHWIYTVSQAGSAHNVNLRAQVRGVTDAVWDMSVSSGSSTPPLNSFKLVTGVAMLHNESGTWRIFDVQNPATPSPLIDINWNDFGDDTWRVVFTNVDPASPHFGDWLDYERTFELRQAKYFDKSSNSTTILGWRLDSSTGYIIAPGYNGGAKSCWNSLLVNVSCPL
jgi:hypothetical protein